MNSTRSRPWKKNLYENEEYEDNYTDFSFLKDLEKNKNVTFFTFTEAVRGAASLNFQISCITAFLIIFHLMYIQQVNPTNILFLSGFTTFIGYFIYIGRDFSFEKFLEDSKTLLTVLAFGFILSPMLHRLTDAISTDTIFFMTFFVMFLNLAFFDYGLNAAIVSGAISLNAAIFGSICLASRLASSYHAFVLLVISADVFVLFPVFLKKFWSPFFLIPVACTCSYFLCFISFPILATYLFVLLFINLIFPYIFVSQQKHKNNIHGPWDEAIVKDAGL